MNNGPSETPVSLDLYCKSPGIYGDVHRKYIEEQGGKILRSQIGETGDRVVVSGTEAQHLKIRMLIKFGNAPFTLEKRPGREKRKRVKELRSTGARQSEPEPLAQLH